MKRNLLFVVMMLLGMQTMFAQTDYALELNGADQRVKYSDNATLDIMDGATDYTIEAWVKPMSNVIDSKVIVKRWYQYAVTLWKDDLKKFYFTHYAADGSTTFMNATDGCITIGEWNHIAVIANSTDNSTKLYVNGVDVTAGSYPAMALISPTQTNANLYIGYQYPYAQFDDVRVEKIALDISNLNTSSPIGKYTASSNTSVLFSFDEGAGVEPENEVDAVKSIAINESTNSVNWIDLTNTLSLSKNNTTEFGIFPNPAVNGFVTIQAQNNELLSSVEVFNTLGKSVRVLEVKNNAKVSLDVQGLTTGLYFVRATTNNGVATQKLVVK